MQLARVLIEGFMIRLLVAGLLCVLASSARAQEFNAVCRFEYSIDDAGNRSPTSGEMSVNVVFMLPAGKPKNVQFKTTKAPCYEFIGDGDDMKVEGTCVRYIDGGRMKIAHVLTIDRVSGTFQQTFQLNDKGGLIHYGRCTRASRMF